MANLLQLINKTATIEKKAKTIVENTIANIKRNKYASKQFMLHHIYNALDAFYKSIGKPNLIVKKADIYPISEDYNTMMAQIKTDFELIDFEHTTLINALNEAYNQMDLDRVMIGNLINNTVKKYEKAKAKLDELNTTNIFMDSFISMNYFDVEACNDIPAFINTNYKYISLATTSLESSNEKATVKIKDGSNGFPGTTHQVTLDDSDIKFQGDNSLKANLADILDTNNETWLEYELFKIDTETQLQCLNLGFNYDEGIKWITDGNQLILELEFLFKEPQLINSITLSPFIAPDKDALPCMIDKIVVSDGKGKINNILEEQEEFDVNKSYCFPRQYCKSVTIKFSQELTYKTLVGHMYFKELGIKNTNYYKKNEVDSRFRTNGTMPSIQNLGIIYDERNKKYLQPQASYGDILSAEQEIKNNLFDIPDDTIGKQSFLESFEANRFLIGIRDVDFSLYAYEKSSEYVSKNYESITPIEAVTLKAEELIPQVFDENEDWVKYYISIDDGVTWYPIVPIGMFKKEGYTRYLINSGISKEFREDNVGYLEAAEDVYKIKTKIEIMRPTNIEDSEYYSPVVYWYKIFA